MPDMSRTPLGRVGVFIARDGVLYPGLVTGGAYLAGTYLTAPFETILFAVFAFTTVIIGIGAMNGSSSNDALQAGAGLTRTGTPGGRWEPATLLRLAAFDFGLAVVLTSHAFWWAVMS